MGDNGLLNLLIGPYHTIYSTVGYMGQMRDNTLLNGGGFIIILAHALFDWRKVHFKGLWDIGTLHNGLYFWGIILQ